MQVPRLMAGLFCVALLSPGALLEAVTLPLAAGDLAKDRQLAVITAGLPLGFEANEGQAEPAVRFLVHGQRANLWLAPQAIGINLQTSSREDSRSRGLRLRFIGANPNPRLEGIEPLAARANYFSGGDPKGWHIQVPYFAQVKYVALYPGVDLIFHGTQQRLEYDFVLQPGADPEGIAFELEGLDKISLEPNGDLRLEMPGAAMRHCKPVIYQEIGSARKTLCGRYVLRSPTRVGFSVGDYDRARPLVIDPVLAYSPNLTGTGACQAYAVAVDVRNNVYVTGSTVASDFPTTGGFQTNFSGTKDVFISKFDTNGAMVFSSFLSGNGAQSGQGIAVDNDGNIYVAGYTSSTNFPTLNPLQATNAGGYDAFVAELNPTGNALLFSTYLGGAGFDAANGLALDLDRGPVLAGYTQSTNFPTLNALQSVYGGQGDAFVAKLNTNGSAFLYSTYLGGNDSENNGPSYDLFSVDDVLAHLGGAVAVDMSGNAYVTGWTFSTNFPVLNALQATNRTFRPGYANAVFVTKLDPTGQLGFSTYFGGLYGDFGRAIGVDWLGNIYFAGSCFGGDLPVTNAFQPVYKGTYGGTFAGNSMPSIGDGFLTALDSTGTNILYCTYLGGSGDEQINGLSVRRDGTVAVTGFTDSPDFPVANAIQTNGHQGCFVSSNGGRSWSVGHAGLNQTAIYGLATDPFAPSVVYAWAHGVFKSTDSGAHWSMLPNIFLGGTTHASGQGLLAFDPVHPGVMYAGAYAGVFKSTDSGASWVSASAGLPTSPWIQALAVDPNAPATLYAGTSSHGVFKSTDGGSNWTVATNGLSQLSVTALLVDPLNSSHVYVGVDNFLGAPLYQSTNAGGSWTAVTSLPSFMSSVMNIAASPANPGTVYVLLGGEYSESGALYVTTNGGGGWSELLEAIGLRFTTLALGNPAVPQLSLGISGNNGLFSWPAVFTNYVLQATPNLNPSQWQTISPAQIITGANVSVTLPMASGQRFYRLVNTNTVPPPPVLYLGTDQASRQGVLQSVDGGYSWQAAGLGGETITALAVNPADSESVYAGVAGGFDGFLASFTPDGRLYSSTYLGGIAADQANAVALSPATTAFVVGSTLSADFPVGAGPAPPPSYFTPPLRNENYDTIDTYDEAFMRAFLNIGPCLQTNVTTRLTMHVGDSLPRELDRDYFYAQLIPPDNQLPTGIGYSLPNEAGNVTPLGSATTPGTYTMHFTLRTYGPDEWCVWDETIIITVVP